MEEVKPILYTMYPTVDCGTSRRAKGESKPSHTGPLTSRSVHHAHVFRLPVRAIESDAPLAHQWDADYVVAEALRDYDCPILEGRHAEAGWQMWQALWDARVRHKQWERCIERREKLCEVRRRFVPFIDDPVELYQDTGANPLCVGDGGLDWIGAPRLVWMSRHG